MSDLVSDVDLMSFGRGVIIKQVWRCDPPPVGVKYRVLGEEWDGDFTMRTITAWEPIVDISPGVEFR